MSRENLSPSEQYIQKHFASEDGDLRRVSEALKADGKFGVNVGSHEGKLLQFLVGLSGAKLVVEIGVLYGYSTLWMAKALPEGGRLVAIERDEKNFAKARELIAASAVANKIQLVQGDAREVLAGLNVQPDLVFIDGNKGGYGHYLDWAMAHIKVGGLIIGDNTFMSGHLIGEDRGEKRGAAAIEAVQYFNETLARHPDYRAIMVPTYEGMTLAQRLR